MTNSHDFPAEFPPDPAGGAAALRWTIGVIAPAALALAVLNTQSIVDWAQELPPAPSTAKIMAAADAWQASSAALGLDAPRNALHRVWKRAEAMQWRAAETK